MAKILATNAEPTPGQFLPKRGNKRSWGKGIVWNPNRQSMKIRKLVEIEKDPATADYMSCNLPSAPNCVGIFLDSETESRAFTVGTLENNKNKVFIGVVNLEKLGLKDQLSRWCGNLSTLYIVKHSPSDPPESGGNTEPE